MHSTKEELIINGLNTTLIRQKRRKSISLVVEPNGLLIKSPMRVSQRTLKEFVMSNWLWVRKKLEVMPKGLRFADGDVFLFLGKERVLRINKGATFTLLEGNSFKVYLPMPNAVQIKKAVHTLFRSEATLLLQNLVSTLSLETNLRPSKVNIRSYTARWGSCSQHGAISLNWKLLIAPVDTIKYVIIHELCHLQEFNHSKNFWALVKTHCPLYKEHMKWLATHGHYLKML